MADAAPQEQQQPPARPKVKSYLHKFYEPSGPAVKDPAVYEPASAVGGATANSEDEMRRLLSCGAEAGGGGGGSAKRRGCHLRPVVWKAMLWIGVNCLIFGALGLAIAFFLPHEPELVELPGAQGFVRSRSNAEWNRSAGVLRYVALGVFGVGAMVTAAGLILPSLVWRLFDEGDSGGTSGGGQLTESCRSSVAKKPRLLSKPRKSSSRSPAMAMTTTATSVTTTAAAGASASATEEPALPSLVGEQPVQPPRSPEGHVSHGEVK